jgi:hypothetical protein
VQGRLRLPVPQGWRVAPAEQPVALAKAGDELTVDFEVTPGASAADARPTLTVGGAEWSLREDVIDHPHIPLKLVLRPSSVRLVPLAIALPRGRIGHIAGPGDSVADDLRHVGVTVVDLDDAALRGGDLDGYAAILVGIRAYNTRAAVRAAQARLMAYVERGGTLVVQYNTQNRISETGGPIGPHPFEISRDRITDENAAPRFVAPAHPAVTRPNRLGPADFDGWVQERGIYFAARWDAKYQPLFAFADPGEAPLEGSTLVAAHGKGRYVYTGLAFFRQLPAGVPGAYRLLANLLAGRR